MDSICSERVFGRRPALFVILLLFAGCQLTCSFAAPAKDDRSGVYAQWPQGPPADAGFFPLAVWLQSPANAEKYRQAGINTFVGLWRGPTEDQLKTLEKAGMRLICSQNAVGLKHLTNSTIIGWMHGDEPDNAQALEKGSGYGPPIAPEKIVADYHRLQSADQSRPVLLNLGQGVAWDRWHGRGVRTNHPEDYPEYMRGGDIISFDIYPANHDHSDVAGQLWYVARGVERLMQWGAGKKVVWNCIECTTIHNARLKPTPHQVRAEVWMSLIHGSRGLIYFVHQFAPTFREAALLDDPEMLSAVAALNRQITQLAPVLNQTGPGESIQVTTDNAEVPVAALARRHQGSLYLFAVSMRNGSAKATFKIPSITGDRPVLVIGEDRSLTLHEGTFNDAFAPWLVHLYRIGLPSEGSAP